MASPVTSAQAPLVVPAAPAPRTAKHPVQSETKPSSGPPVQLRSGENNALEIAFDETIDRVVVKIKSATGEVVRQIPPEEFVRFAKHFRETFGPLFDTTA